MTCTVQTILAASLSLPAVFLLLLLLLSMEMVVVIATPQTYSWQRGLGSCATDLQGTILCGVLPSGECKGIFVLFIIISVIIIIVHQLKYFE